MAVKPEKITARVRVLYPNANLSKLRMDEISARLAKKPEDDADDAAIDLVINEANDFMPFEDIAKQDDKLRTLEAKKPKEPANPAGPTEEVEDEEDKKLSPTDKLLKQMSENITKLTEKVTTIETGKVIDTKKSIAQIAFEKSEVFKNMKPELKENWLKRIAVTDETTEEEINTQVTSLETEFSDLQQSFADSVGYGGPGGKGTGDIKFSEEEAAKIVDNIL